ncbi:hypothetical protein [Lysobacter enzymogenes]|uniref:hypothetical protein n=1 Tax=Lysobacter enzymogenes TaxID=69 RepID=UPI000A4A71F2|nr:hypothetical protein [Lysobacter enzymogenes]
MKAAILVQDSFRALPRYLFVLTAVSALALLARAAVPSSVSSPHRFPEPVASAFAVAAAAAALDPASPAARRSMTPAAMLPLAPAFAAQTRLPGPFRLDSRPPMHLRYFAAAQTPLSATPH